MLHRRGIGVNTAEQIYHRILWDPGLEAARFRVGYDSRLPAPVEVPLLDFEPDGEVPWHRIVYFAADGEVVWNRPMRVDRLGEGKAGRTLLCEPLFSRRPPCAFDPEADAWVPAKPGRHAVRSLRVLTWNVLFDRYETERIETARRRPMLLRALEAADADVIALQEVEPPLLKMLLAEPWVRARYVTSDGPSGRSVKPYGVTLLSRAPVLELAWHELDPHKKILAMVIATRSRPLVITTVHLTSDYARNGVKKREKQLAIMRDALRPAAHANIVALGDFNADDDTPSRALQMRDAWLERHGEPAPTYDPPNNPLAAMVSKVRVPLRLDRVLLRGDELGAIGIERIGTTPENGLFASDHYGLVADITLRTRV